MDCSTPGFPFHQLLEGACSNSCPSSQWCHPTILSSVIPFSCPQSFPASGSFPMSQLFAWSGQSTGVSALASVLPMNTQDGSPLEWTGWISSQSKGLGANYFTILWWFLPYIDMNQPWVYMCPHPEPPCHLPPHPIPQGHPSAPALSTLSHALNLEWQSISHMVIYMLQCYSLKSSHPCLLPQSPKVCSWHLCLFCCLS